MHNLGLNPSDRKDIIERISEAWSLQIWWQWCIHNINCILILLVCCRRMPLFVVKDSWVTGHQEHQQLSFKQFKKKSFLYCSCTFSLSLKYLRGKKEREREQQAKTPKRIQMRKPRDKCRKWAIVWDSWLGVFKVNEMENKKAEFRGRG